MPTLSPEAQITAPPIELPTGDRDAIRDQVQQELETMLLDRAGSTALDPEKLRNATPDERNEMLRGGAGAMSGQAIKRQKSILHVSEKPNVSVAIGAGRFTVIALIRQSF